METPELYHTPILEVLKKMISRTKIILILFCLTTTFSCSSQINKTNNPKLEISKSLQINFPDNTIVLTDDIKNKLDGIADYVLKNENYKYSFQVIPSSNEISDNSLEFKRVEMIINYLDKIHKLNRNIFKFTFFEPIPSKGYIKLIIDKKENQ